MPRSLDSTDALPPFRQAAIELLRAIRGPRSQVAFARRLGYRSNPITDWEHGRREPTAVEALRAADAVRLPVREAFRTLHPAPPPRVEDGRWQLHDWLSNVQGGTPILELARRTGRSRYTVSRWLTGHSQPKLHEFLEFVHAMTGRVHDWVAALVPIDQVPALFAGYRQAQAAKTLAFEHPWSEAILRVLETDAYRAQPELTHQTLAAWLGVSEETFLAALDGLLKAGVIQNSQGKYVVVGHLSVDTRDAPGGMRHLQRHWLSVAEQRATRSSSDWFGYNVISVSHDDLARIEECLKRTYRETRSIVAASEPSQSAALLLMQLVRFGPEQEGGMQKGGMQRGGMQKGS